MQAVFDRVIGLKQLMSAYCHCHIKDLFVAPKDFSKQYSFFTSKDLNAWERPTLLSDIAGLYLNRLSQRFGNADATIQTGMCIVRYKNTVYRFHNKEGQQSGTHCEVLHCPGDVKSFEIEKQHTELSAALKYLLYLDIETFSPNIVKDKRLQAIFARLIADPFKWNKLCTLAKAKQARLLGSVKLIHFTTGSHRRQPRESGSMVVKDEKNGLYQWFYRFRIGTGKERQHFYLPLLYNKKRKKPEI